MEGSGAQSDNDISSGHRENWNRVVAEKCGKFPENMGTVGGGVCEAYTQYYIICKINGGITPCILIINTSTAFLIYCNITNKKVIKHNFLSPSPGLDNFQNYIHTPFSTPLPFLNTNFKSLCSPATSASSNNLLPSVFLYSFAIQLNNGIFL